MIYVGDSVLVGVLADYEELPEFKLVHNTELTTGGVGGTGVEVRNNLWHSFRRGQGWQVKLNGAENIFSFEEQIRVAQEDKACCVPYFAALNQVESILNLDITLSLPLGVSQSRGNNVWWFNPFTKEFGYLEVNTGVGYGISAYEAIPEGLVAGCFIAPLIFGVLESVKKKEINGDTYIYSLSFLERAGTGTGTARTIVEALTLSLNEISGELVNVSPNRETSDNSTVSIVLSGSLFTVVVSSSGSENTSLSLTIAGSLATFVLNTNISESSALSIAISGSLI